MRCHLHVDFEADPERIDKLSEFLCHMWPRVGRVLAALGAHVSEQPPVIERDERD